MKMREKSGRDVNFVHIFSQLGNRCFYVNTYEVEKAIEKIYEQGYNKEKCFNRCSWPIFYIE